MGAPSIAADPTLVNPRLAASAETLVITALILLLYVYRRRSYILWWMWGWAALSAATVITIETTQGERLDAIVFGTAQFLRIVAGLLFGGAADCYRRPRRITRGQALALLPVA